MAKKLVHLVLLVFALEFGIQAQFDDVYYDPNAFGRDKKQLPRAAREIPQSPEQSSADGDGDFDWEEGFDDSQYEYSARIRRFHRPFGFFDYYAPCYVYPYFYDPCWDDPWWYWDGDIYSFSWNPYGNFWRWRRWRYFYAPPPYISLFWSPWSFYWGGWGSWNYWGPGFGFGNVCGWNAWCVTNACPIFGVGFFDNNSRSHPTSSGRDRYYGSRRQGFVNTSKNGPVRVFNPSAPTVNSTETLGGVGLLPANDHNGDSNLGTVFENKEHQSPNIDPERSPKPNNDRVGSAQTPRHTFDSPRGDERSKPQKSIVSHPILESTYSPVRPSVSSDQKKFGQERLPRPDRKAPDMDFQPHGISPRESQSGKVSPAASRAATGQDGQKQGAGRHRAVDLDNQLLEKSVPNDRNKLGRSEFSPPTRFDGPKTTSPSVGGSAIIRNTGGRHSPR